MKNHFKPAWWLPGPHLQTMWPTLRKRKIDLPLVRERLLLKILSLVIPTDNGRLKLDLHS